MNIAFCINRLILMGLGVTITSLLRNCSESKKLNFWFLCSNLGLREKNKIVNLLLSENFEGKYHFIDFDPFKIFGNLASLHGDWTTYGRLLLPEILNEDKVLYLDADLVVEVDVLELEEFEFNGLSLAAVGGGYFKFALGQKFYIEELGIDPNLEYFNAGVVFLNLKEWRAKDLKNTCLKIASIYPQDLPSHDQSLLNIICMGQFAKLPDSFNCSWLADKNRPQVAEKMIMHFVGSPKPWDPFGFIIHNGYRTWRKYLTNSWKSNLFHLNLMSLLRVWHLRNSYVRCIYQKIS